MPKHKLNYRLLCISISFAFPLILFLKRCTQRFLSSYFHSTARDFSGWDDESVPCILFFQCGFGVFHQPRPLLVSSAHRVSAGALRRAPPPPQHRLLFRQLQRVQRLPLCSLWSFVRFVFVIISTHNISYLCRWTRISIPLPNAALTEMTRFRWKQLGSGAGSMWAVDNGEAYDTLPVWGAFF